MGDIMGFVEDLKKKLGGTTKQSNKKFASKEEYRLEAKRRGEIGRIERKAKKIMKEDVEKERKSRMKIAKKRYKQISKILVQKDTHGRSKVQTGAKKLAKAIAKKRKYKKTSKWYKRRYDSREGDYHSPSEFRRGGIQRFDTESKFSVGGVSRGGSSIAELGLGRPVERGFKSPLFNDEGTTGLGGNNDLLDLGLSNSSNKKKRKIKWF